MYRTSFLLFLFLSAAALAKPIENAQRIVALSPHSVELLYSIGAGDRIVGTTQFADFPETAKTIPRVGGHGGLNVERILELKPDLIVVWKSGNPSGDLAQMKKLGLPVYESDPKRLDQIADELIALGKLTGLQQQAKAASDEFRKTLTHLRETNKGKEKVRFFYQLWPKPLRGIGPKSWINEVMVACGGENILGEGFSDYPEISLETVLLEKPDVILWPDHHGREKDKVNWDVWPEIPAVKNQHVYELEGDHMHRFTVRILLGMAAVCEVFDQARESHSALSKRSAN